MDQGSYEPTIWGESTPIGYDLGYQAFHKKKMTYVLKKKVVGLVSGYVFFTLKPMETTIVDGF